MSQQFTVQINPSDPFHVSALFQIGDSLRQRGYGVTVFANVSAGYLTTDAPKEVVTYTIMSIAPETVA